MLLFHKKVLLIFLFAIISLSNLAISEEEHFDLQIYTFTSNGITNYVLCDENGVFMHEPTQYPIDYVLSYIGNGDGKTEIQVYGRPVPYSDQAHLALYIPSTGCFSDFVYKDVSRCEFGLIPVADFESGLWGYIDIEGKTVIPMQWVNASSFHDGCAKVYYRTAIGYAYVIINTEGVIVDLAQPSH